VEKELPCGLPITPATDWGVVGVMGLLLLLLVPRSGGVKMTRNKIQNDKIGRKTAIPLKATDRLCPPFFKRPLDKKETLIFKKIVKGNAIFFFKRRAKTNRHDL
jgi:hypothetical protein